MIQKILFLNNFIPYNLWKKFKRAAKNISGLKGHTYEERLKEVGLLTLEERRHQSDMVQTYKIVTDSVADP
jgi:hypothetical protein